MKHVNVTIIVTSCDDSELYVKSVYEECEVAKLLNNPALNLLKPYAEQLLGIVSSTDDNIKSVYVEGFLEMEGTNDHES